jgi:hypothetical protein
MPAPARTEARKKPARPGKGQIWPKKRYARIVLLLRAVVIFAEVPLPLPLAVQGKRQKAQPITGCASWLLVMVRVYFSSST